ncbi:hypothetical protein [Methyloligella halotolerans]|uniref:hypothetical protein n=1 Tax=Methyloligella halotolerans TaxID=1177755 RepID=UPI00114D329F|nr:hypothetical protein [Methyloligella halotolerans]
MSQSSRLSQLRRRFRFVAGEKGQGRRRDYRGDRVRLNLRVSEGLGRQLDELKRLSGTDKNVFCERAIEQAVRDALVAARSETTEGGTRADQDI